MFSTKQILVDLESKIRDLKLGGEPQKLYTPIEYIMEDGGKRMRPLLTLLAASMFEDEVRDEVFQAAIALEVFHNFTLLHDDIMDGAPMRRGRDTVHVKWNENVAILSGDAMLILAYRLMSGGVVSGKLATVMEIFNKAAMEVCEGQQFDMDFEEMERVSIGEYINMIRLKTAVLMAAALEIGAYLGGATAKQREFIYDFGLNLGLAFQIQDDILDTYGDAKTFGKTIGGDIAVGKKTFLYITAFDNADARQRDVLAVSRDLETVRGVYNQLGVREVAEVQMQQYFTAAMSALSECCPETHKREALQQYALELLKRKK